MKRPVSSVALIRVVICSLPNSTSGCLLARVQAWHAEQSIRGVVHAEQLLHSLRAPTKFDFWITTAALAVADTSAARASDCTFGRAVLAHFLRPVGRVLCFTKE